LVPLNLASDRTLGSGREERRSTNDVDEAIPFGKLTKYPGFCIILGAD
jgi:hypothetical protein